MSTRKNIARALPIVLLAMAAALLAQQLRSLFLFPQPNSFRWFGDETWLMVEAIKQIATGVVHYPLAIGSTLEHGKGLVLSMTWLSALIYGLPALLSGYDPVASGRIVTSVLALGLLVLLYRSARTFGASRFAALIAIVLLISTRSFFFASHSARPDLLAGLVVLGSVAICAKLVRDGKQYSSRWWFGYGATVIFLSLSSSIHLLTLLVPVSLFFMYRLGGMRRVSSLASVVGGAAVVAALLIAVYWCTTGNLTLFSTSVGPVQFHDVISSIPIWRPFSRSVQVANVVIRFKQFASEAPQVFLLLALIPFVWRRIFGRSHPFATATAIVFLSWLLLEGAEINYLMHLLPLLFLGMAIMIDYVANEWKCVGITVLTGIAVVAFGFGCRDSSEAFATASLIDRSNQINLQMLEADILVHWRDSEKPCVICEPFALDRISQDTNIEAMTDHFISFPAHSWPLDTLLQHEHVNFAVLYNSPVYPKDRAKDDPFYLQIARSGRLIGSYIGTSGDMGRDYFNGLHWRDTLLLYQFPQ